VAELPDTKWRSKRTPSGGMSGHFAPVLFSLCYELRDGSRTPPRFTFGFEAVCVMDKSVENGLGQGRVPDSLVPEFDRELGGDHR
jgi:hypothetical protein